MKKFWKILGIIAATLFVVFLIAVVLIIRALPSPSDIGRALRPTTVRTALKTASAPTKPGEAPAPTPVEEAAPAADDNIQDGNIHYNGKSPEDQKVFEDIADPKKPLAEFCQYLRNSPQANMNGMSLTEFGQKFKQSALTEDKDPLIQAIKPTFRYVFNQPKMRSLVDEAMASVDQGEDANGLMSKAGFYAKAYSAFNELRANKQHIEGVMDRSYDLMIMSRVIAKKPELLSDNHVADYCRSIENAINNGTPISREVETAEFQKFLAESGVDAKSVGYDPNYKTNLNVTFSMAGVHMKGGWIDSVLRPTQKELRSIESQAKKTAQ